MSNNNYEAIARENGFEIVQVLAGELWFWCNDSLELLGRGRHNIKENCWKACCVENGLIVEE